MAKDLKKEALDLHRENKGKLEVKSKIEMNEKNLALAYTPGVAEPCKEIASDLTKVYDYTIKKNCVAVVSDGSAVLGLGDIGAEASIPVMEGKAILFKEFAGIDAFPICLKTQEPEEIISIVKNIAPVFGGINLEDIKAPKCFEIEDALQDIGIPVMHDDQHGTAIVVRAGLLNACKVLGKNFNALKVVINGAGAAGTAIAKLLVCEGYGGNVCKGVREVIVLDSNGAISKNRTDLVGYKKELAEITNKDGCSGSLGECIEGADVFIGVSKGGVLKEEMVKKMNGVGIVFALANPVPEIMPDVAKKAGADIVATGRSDFPNQVNNVLAFPGIFRGALDAKAKKISPDMKLMAAEALASCVENPKVNKILPGAFDKGVAEKVAEAVKKAAE